MMIKDEPMSVYIDGVQVLSSRYVFEQMQRQSCRIDMCYTVAKVSCIFSLLAFFLAIATLIATLLKAL